MTGYVIQVSNLKYLKIVFFGFAYAIAVFIAYLSWMIAFGFLEMNFLASIFQFVFYALAWTTLPLFVLTVYILITSLIKDSKISEALSRGIRMKE